MNIELAGRATLLTALFAVSLSAAETNVFYTVTVDNGTHEEPVSLDTLSVTVERPDADPGAPLGKDRLLMRSPCRKG